MQDVIYDENIDGKAFELVNIRDFSSLAEYVFGLHKTHLKALSIFMSDHYIGDSFDLRYIEEVFRQMNVMGP